MLTDGLMDAIKPAHRKAFEVAAHLEACAKAARVFEKPIEISDKDADSVADSLTMLVGINNILIQNVKLAEQAADDTRFALAAVRKASIWQLLGIRRRLRREAAKAAA